MFARPSLRVVVATTSAAALLVGGAQLASYAATHHGHSGAATSRSSQPKTITFTLGSNGQSFGAGSAHLFTAKVPKGTYSVGISGFLQDTSGTFDDTQSYTCLLTDKRTLLHVLQGSGNFSGAQRLYSLTGQSAGDGTFAFGLVNDANPVAKVDRPNVIYGCLLNGGPYTVIRPLKFALTPIKATNKKGKKFTLPAPKARQLARALR
jgi:hypothetical protein